MSTHSSENGSQPHHPWFIALFWNHRERRLRAAWRLLLVLSTIAVSELIGSRIAWRLGWPYPVWILLAAAGFYPVALYLAGRLIDHRSLSDYGLHLDSVWWSDFIFGLGLGALLMSLLFLVEFALGWVTVVDTLAHAPSSAFIPSFARVTVLFLFVSVREELVVRGYALHNLAEGLKCGPTTARVAVIVAWVLSAIGFGLLHADNPYASATSTLNLMLAGLFLGLPLILTGRLAISLGLHWTWNLCQGQVFGFPVSGLRVSETSFLRLVQHGPERWTGGAFGPEAGYIGVLAILLGMVCIWARERRRPHYRGLAANPARE